MVSRVAGYQEGSSQLSDQDKIDGCIFLFISKDIPGSTYKGHTKNAKDIQNFGHTLITSACTHMHVQILQISSDPTN